jgi:SPP1 gp7 family putative phage head morphogenesis protein
MDTQISRTLTAGLIEGKNPKAVARELSKVVDLGRKRAETLARTEMVRAHNHANLTTYEEAGIGDVTVLAEWKTAGYNVCPDCAALEGKVFKISTIRQLIPLHPNCRCVALPYIEEVMGKPKKKSPFHIKNSVRAIVGADYKNKAGRIKLRGIMKKKLQGASIPIDDPKGVF